MKESFNVVKSVINVIFDPLFVFILVMFSLLLLLGYYEHKINNSQVYQEAWYKGFTECVNGDLSKVKSCREFANSYAHDMYRKNEDKE